MTYDDPGFLEAVYQALFDLVKGAPWPIGFELVTARRAVDTPDDVPAASQPALFQVQGAYGASQKEFALTKWELSVVEVIYFRMEGTVVASRDQLPDTTMNNVLWAVYGALRAPADGERQTLGGLAQHAWIDGAVVPVVAGEDSLQAVLMIPIKVLV